jgi:SanA protein
MLKKLLLLAVILVLLVVLNHLIIGWMGNARIYDQVESVPNTKVGLVLGTSSRVKGGRANLYFSNRIAAATELYKSGAVQKLLVSGDNRVANYNEPLAMQQALMENGVPENDIVLDYAGLRTFDSMVRAKKVFGQDTIIIVSQKFHLQRALFIAKSEGIMAYGFEAKDPGTSAQTKMREIPARMKALIDCYIFPAKPRHLGDAIIID